VMLRDVDADGVADVQKVVFEIKDLHGIVIDGTSIYLVDVDRIYLGTLLADGGIDNLQVVSRGIPEAGQHPNRTLNIGPDGSLYVSIGSTCNACRETSPEYATVSTVDLTTGKRSIFASGLRNTIGFDWHPVTGELWGFDHGIDFLGDDQQPEELNLIRRGKQYGWPHVFGKGELNPQSTPPGEISKEQWRSLSEPMVVGYTAHAAPMQLVFYRGGNFPKEYTGDAFATMRGSWNRKPASGYELVRVHFENNSAVRVEPFVSGFLADGGRTHFARPMGLALANDGSLLMADDANGVIYRIAYQDREKIMAETQKPPPSAMEQQAKQGASVPLARQRREARAKDTLAVTSRTIHGKIPEMHSEYADGVSPAISWNKVDGAKSYALILEDPDAKSIKPFVHWVAYNIPANVTSLPEGLQEQPRLTEPEGILQGRTSRGSVGYFGPRPPVGDPPHHYHFQVFALDRELDVPPGAERDEVLKAMEGHVLAAGEIVGTYQQTVEPPK
jgi:Raf kinase inhibitor-like YbhB/YbcL family protein